MIALIDNLPTISINLCEEDGQDPDEYYATKRVRSHQKHQLQHQQERKVDNKERINQSKEIFKVFSTFIFLVCSASINWIVLSYIHDFAGREPLPDIIFSFIPQQPWALRVGDFMIFLCSLSLTLLMIFHKHRMVLFRRMFFIFGVLYLLRAIILFCTQLPSGYTRNDLQCYQKLNKSEISMQIYFKRFLYQAARLGYQDMDYKMLCGDLLFSGHTIVAAISSLSFQYYWPSSIRYVRYLVQLFCWIGIICIVISRTHYTVDVIIAYWLSSAVFTDTYIALAGGKHSIWKDRTTLYSTIFQLLPARKYAIIY